MKCFDRLLKVAAVIHVLWVGFAFGASEPHTDQHKTVNIQSQILECNAILSDASMGDGIGLPLSTGKIEDFKQAFIKRISEKGRESVVGSEVYVTGIAMGNEKAIRSQYESVIGELGFSKSEIKVKVLSAPRSLLAHEEVNNAVQEIFHRMRYFIAPRGQQFQVPTWAEIRSGSLVTAAIEFPTIVYLVGALGHVNAEVAISIHTATLAAYTIWSQTLLNWLLLPGAGRMEKFLKQCMMSMPFIVNYRIFGHFTEIVARIQTQGFDQAIRAHGIEAMEKFIASDGMTTILQTIFYSTVIVDRAGGWVYGQTIEKNQLAARAVRPFLQWPILVMDAALMAYSAQTQNVLFHLGPLNFTDAHLGFIGITGIGMAAYRPVILDAIGLKPALYVQNYMERSKGFFAASKWNPSTVFKKEVLKKLVKRSRNST